MSITVEAVYEAGVFRVLEPVPFAEGKRVALTVDAEDAEPNGSEKPKLNSQQGSGISCIDDADLHRTDFRFPTRDKPLVLLSAGK